VAPGSDNKITQDHVKWAYRLFLDREPENDTALSRRAPDTQTLRREFLQSAEFEAKNPGFATSIDKWVIVPTRLGFRIFIALNEFGISRPILLDEYEPEAVVLFKSHIRLGDRVLDVGANIGFHSLLFAQLVGPTGQVVSFEPVKYLYDALNASIAENHFQDRCQPYHCAISDRAGRALIRHAPGTTNFGGGHLAERKQDDGHAYDEIETQTLSHFISNDRCSFVKIDAEGAEAKILQGGVDLLQRDRPLVFVELFNAQLQRVSGVDATTVIRSMATHGYRCFETRGGKPGQQLEAYDAPEIINVLFAPRS
jgi:FkbM family methyltransferase